MKQKTKKLSLFFILLVIFVNYMGIGLIYPLFATLLFDPSLSFLPADSSHLYRGFVLGILLALMPLMQFFFSPYLGKKSDSIGRKNILIFCLGLSTIGYCIALWGIFEQSLTALIFFRVFLGISGASVAIVQAILIDISEGKKAKYLSLFNLAMGAGFTIGPFIGGFFSAKNIFFAGNIAFPFFFALALTLANLFLALRYLTESKKETPVSASPKLSMTFSSGHIKSLLTCMFIFSFGWSFFFEFLPIFLMGQFSFSSTEIGYFYGYSGIFYMICSAFVIQPLIQRLKSQVLLFSSFIFAGFYIFLIYTIEQPYLLWFYIPVLVCLIAMIFPTTSYLISNIADEERQGEALGGLIAIQSLAFAVSPLLSGFLIGVHYATPVFMASGSFILSGMIYGYHYLKKGVPVAEEAEDLEAP